MLSLFAALALAPAAPVLPDYWTHPPMEARIRAYWWWLNGNVTEASITRDLEQMRAKGFGGAILCDANGAEQEGNAAVPHGPDFFSPAWRALYRHALQEADRLGLEISLSIQSGWNLGGPMVPARDAAKKLVWSVSPVLSGGERVAPSLNLALRSRPSPLPLSPRGERGSEGEVRLAEPRHSDPYYQDLFVIAYPDRGEAAPIALLAEKSLQKALGWSAPDTSPLLSDALGDANEPRVEPGEVVDLTGKMLPDGTLRWKAPPGKWKVLRLGCTVGDHARVSTSSDGWKGYAIDPYDKGAFDRYWNAVVEPLLSDAKGHPSLRYLHTDSWEVEAASWTPTLRGEFRKRRGYDLLRYLPVMTGALVGGREASNRFLFDFRRTMGDLAIAHHYEPFRTYAHRHGLGIHPESGGPHSSPIDAQQCLGMDDAPMSEFWARSWTHRVKDEDRFFVKQPASAAHTYGHRFVLAEGFTTIGPHWQETLWDNLKPSFDRALTEGLNRLVWHAFVCSPESEGLPGQQYFAGTHLNPNVTWWERSKPFFDYLNRCQAMLQRGLPVADVLVYYGDNVPNFTQLRSSDPAHLGPGYDYDVVTAEGLLKRARAEKGRIVMPDGMSYARLVLPSARAISLPVLRKVVALAKAGVDVVGGPYAQATGLAPSSADAEVRRLSPAIPRSPRPLAPDFEGEKLQWIHRRDGAAEIYFVSNPSATPVQTSATFRVEGKTPEIWDPVTRDARFVAARSVSGRTSVELNLPAYGSAFVVFRSSAGRPAEPASLESLATLQGPWTVEFDPKWGGPARATFDRLVDWTTRPEASIRYYSGKAIYRTTFEVSGVAPTTIDLGLAREVASARLNGKDLGTVWAPPFRLPLGGAVRPGRNELEVEVINFWPNRIIGDAVEGTHFTRTNVRKLTKDSPLMPSGLLGPVVLLR